MMHCKRLGKELFTVNVQVKYDALALKTVLLKCGAL